jgi:hypothetical protein
MGELDVAALYEVAQRTRAAAAEATVQARKTRRRIVAERASRPSVWARIGDEHTRRSAREDALAKRG